MFYSYNIRRKSISELWDIRAADLYDSLVPLSTIFYIFCPHTQFSAIFSVEISFWHCDGTYAQFCDFYIQVCHSNCTYWKLMWVFLGSNWEVESRHSLKACVIWSDKWPYKKPFYQYQLNETNFSLVTVFFMSISYFLDVALWKLWCNMYSHLISPESQDILTLRNSYIHYHSS